ncbi:hypothetical protein AYI69_g2433 [Smittium culicis]|uniref:Uncharacterized protein n=1 Tax=Smittium culicis TaxID=133412 RepID=A0A1R1YME6_9FUNG|nr:hypothetical protein AYI69_g2433 [Smittium culicis]
MRKTCAQDNELIATDPTCNKVCSRTGEKQSSLLSNESSTTKQNTIPNLHLGIEHELSILVDLVSKEYDGEPRAELIVAYLDSIAQSNKSASINLLIKNGLLEKIIVTTNFSLPTSFKRDI